ncbi:tetratricopeptide repeat protein [Emticicia sp.]|uniref:tetratricopeptide repeat protein n=1 Tax=Emticicia sp. TaxID=1930953 RepID=UPI003BAC7C66
MKAKKEKYITQKHWHKFSYNSSEWQMYLDSALAIEPKYAYLWQQKSMPNFKSGKYYDGMKFLNKAVEYDTLAWLGYRGFMKCVFMKDYANAITDLKAIYKKRPIDQIMDHSFPFWIGISYLKLGKLDSADYYLGLSVNNSLLKGKEAVHYVDWFYWGLTKYKQKKYKEALSYLENAMAQNSHFPDAEYYKAMVLLQINQKEAAKVLLVQAKTNIEAGYRMNEDNESYVNYPYQITTFEIDEVLAKL